MLDPNWMPAAVVPDPLRDPQIANADPAREDPGRESRV